MTEQAPDAARFGGSQHAAVTARNEDQDRTLRALQRLERSAGSPMRADTWGQETLAALVALDEATADEQANANQPDSLLSDIARTQPRLRNRVRGIRTQYAQIRDAITTLRNQMAVPETTDHDNADLRRQIARLASLLRYQRSRESDLVYEAFYDAFNTELDT